MRYLQLTALRTLIRAVAEAFGADPATTFVGGGAARYAIDPTWSRQGSDIDVFLGIPAGDDLVIPDGWIQRADQGYQTYIQVWEHPRFKGVQVIQVSHGLLIDNERQHIESFDIPEHRAAVYLDTTADLTRSALTEFGLCESTLSRVRKALTLTADESRQALYRAVERYAALDTLPDHTPVTFLGHHDVSHVPFITQPVALIGHETFITAERTYASRQDLFEDQARRFSGDYVQAHCLAGRRWMIENHSGSVLELRDPRRYRLLSFHDNGAGWSTWYDRSCQRPDWTVPTALTVPALLGHPDTHNHAERWYVFDDATGQLRYEQRHLTVTHGGLTLSVQVTAGMVEHVQASGSFAGTREDRRQLYAALGSYLPDCEIERHLQQTHAF